MGDCPTEERLLLLAQRRLPEPETALLHRHLDACADCRQLVSLLAQTEAPPSASTAETQEGPPPSHAALAAQSEPWTPPLSFDEYRLIRPLGHGAMGQVYLATDTLLDRRVAIKFIAAGHRRPATRERFLVEARAVARLHHRNVVAIHRMGEVAGRPYLVSEFVRGKSLAEVPRPLPWEEVVDLGVRLADALSAAHRAGVLHRDIKPANVMLTDEGEVKLLDFGLAKLSDEVRARGSLRSPTMDSTLPGASPAPVAASPALTHAGAILGTPQFLAPEVWTGDPATARSDLYALGALLYELSSGRVPHTGQTLEELRRRVTESEAPPPLCTVAPTVDARLGAVVDRCLRRAPRERYDSADALLADLAVLQRKSDTARTGTDAAAAPDAALHNEGDPYVTTGRRTLLAAPPRRRIRAWTALALVAGALGIAGAALALVARRGGGEAWRPLLAQRTPYEENGGGAAISPDGKWLAFTSNRDGTYRIWVEPMEGGEAHAVTPRERTTGIIRWTRDDALLFDSDGFIYRMQMQGGRPVEAPRLVTAGQSPADCGGAVVLVRHSDVDGWRLVARARDGTERELVQSPESVPIQAPQCDPQAQRVVYATGSYSYPVANSRCDLAVVPLQGGAPVRLTDDHAGNVNPVFAPDGKSVIFTSHRGGVTALWEISAAGGRPRQLTFGPGEDLRPTISPDGSTLVFVQDQTNAPPYAYPLATGARRVLTRRLDGHLTLNVAAAGDREMVAQLSARGKAQVVLLALDGGGERALHEGQLVDAAADRGEVYVAAPAGDAKGGTRILAIPLAGPLTGTRAIADVTGDVYGCLDGERVLHLHLPSHDPARALAWRVPAAGGPLEIDAPLPWLLVCPAKAGGWSWAARGDGPKRGYHLFGPGVPPGGRSRPLPDGCGPPRWSSDGDDALLYPCPDGSIRRLHVADNREETLHNAGAETIYSVALTPDGKTLLYSQILGSVRRIAVTNFASRPRP